MNYFWLIMVIFFALLLIGLKGGADEGYVDSLGEKIVILQNENQEEIEKETEKILNEGSNIYRQDFDNTSPTTRVLDIIE